MRGLFYVKQIAFSTIDGNIEFAHSQSVQLYFDVKSVNSVFVSDKIIDNNDNFRINYLSHTVKPLIKNTSEEFIKCRLDNFSMSFILYYVNFSICENK